ncbi:MAG: DUF3577 domain-containing protein [Gammaproteobacteria bacterium]|nr:DUF3577 domain-containing protein [Gammaproteobacteria bacterium]
MKTRELSYFDLFTTGVGYLNRVTEVTTEEGTPFLAVKIAALRGRTTNVKKTYFDATVSGPQAHEWVRLLADDVAHGRNVLIRFRLSDLEGTTYFSKHESDEGQARVSLRTRLIGVDWARVDGQVIQPERRHAA